MTRRERNRIIADINKQFSELGTTMPASTSNMSPIAWEYFMASHVSSLCSGRVKKAKTAAIKAGVLPDYEDHPVPPGEYKPIFDGEHVAIDLLVRQPSHTTDVTRLVDFLIGCGVARNTMDEAMQYASKTSRPAHVFSSRIKVEDEDE